MVKGGWGFMRRGRVRHGGAEHDFGHTARATHEMASSTTSTETAPMSHARFARFLAMKLATSDADTFPSWLMSSFERVARSVDESDASLVEMSDSRTVTEAMARDCRVAF